MVQANSCDGCSHAHDCQRIYEQVGQTGGPSVAMKVTIAFVLPIVVFVAGLATFGHFVRERLAAPYQTPVAFVLALTITVAVMLVVSRILKRVHRKP